MATVGLVARAGSVLGDRATPVDVLRPDSARAQRLVAEYRDAVEGTEYVRRFLGSDEPLPVSVVEEYAGQACLCRLQDRPSEQDALHAALFSAEPNGDDHSEDDALRRRREAVAHFLSLIEAAPDIAVDEFEFRHQLWESTGARGAPHRVVADRWAALVAKDVWQEAIASLWADFCRRGLQRVRELGRGLAPSEVQGLAVDMLGGPPGLPEDMRTADLVAAIDAGTISLTVGDEIVDPAATELEGLRAATAHLDTAASALVVLLELARRAQARPGEEWTSALGIASAWQPSVRDALTGFGERPATGESVADTLWWLLDRFVIGTHERIAYSKLPDNTFRFRWEEGLLRFFDNGARRFPVASVRHWPLRSLTFDLGLWHDQSAPALTNRGAAFVREVFS
jgi:hypothetical protein